MRYINDSGDSISISISESDPKNKYTPLIHDIKNQNIEVMEWLLKHGANIEDVNNEIGMIIQFIFSFSNIENNEDQIIHTLDILIKYHLDVNREHNNNTLLNQAIIVRNEKIINYLIENKADINQAKSCMNYIDKIIQENRLNQLKFLLDHHLNPNIKDHRDQTLLIIGIKYKNMEALNLLKQYGLHPSLLKINLETVANHIANRNYYWVEKKNANGNVKCTDLLEWLYNNDFDINTETESGNSLLVYAYKYMNLEMIKYLIEHGSNVERVHSRFDIINYILGLGEYTLIDYLIQRNLNINQLDDKGNSYIYYSIEKGDIEAIKYLLRNKADVSFLNKGEKVDAIQFIIDLASWTYRFNIFKDMIKNGFNINTIFKDGNTVLVYAAQCNHLETMKSFIEWGADPKVLNNRLDILKKLFDTYNITETLEYLFSIAEFDINAKDENGENTLIHAISFNNSEAIKFLLERGVNIEILNENIDIVMKDIIDCNNIETLELLLKYHLDINSKNKEGITMLDYAIQMKNQKMENFLKEYSKS